MTIQTGRKTFSGAGRKRLAGPRYKNGDRVKKKSSEATAGNLAVVLAQPHRRGSTDQRRHLPITRLIMDGKVKHSRLSAHDLERAAELYRKAYANWRWVMDCRRPLAKMTGGSGEPTAAEADVFKAGWERVTRALRACGTRVEKAIDAAVLKDDPDFPEDAYAPWIILSLPQGLEAIADHYGLTTNRACRIRK
ncbi:hypothetical protein [Microvirga antarctica]|uniref:hypothetical protein n=1 Tax=Microvirga antarctica TaxID=2819233 RepID=UPI001B307370|nr:hypothetical protein [Microvirga antarctica]